MWWRSQCLRLRIAYRILIQGSTSHLPINRMASAVSSCHALDTTQSSIKPLSRQKEPTSTVKVMSMMTGSGDRGVLYGNSSGQRELLFESVLHNEKFKLKQSLPKQTSRYTPGLSIGRQSRHTSAFHDAARCTGLALVAASTMFLNIFIFIYL